MPPQQDRIRIDRPPVAPATEPAGRVFYQLVWARTNGVQRRGQGAGRIAR